MDIPKTGTLSFLSRTDLCTKKEAVTYAGTLNPRSYSVWEAVFNREDYQKDIRENFSVKKALYYSKYLEPIDIWSETWKVVLKRADVKEFLLRTLTPTEAIAFAKRFGSWRIWEIIMERGDVGEYLLTTLAPAEVIAYAQKIGNRYLWKTVLQRKDISPTEIITETVAFSKVDYDSDIWEVVFQRVDVQEYLLATLSVDEVISYASEINYWRVWSFIFQKRENLPLKETILAYKNRSVQWFYYGADIDQVVSLILGINKLDRYLLRILSPAEAVKFSQEVDHYEVWKWILMRKDILPDEALSYAKGVNHWKVWTTVLERDDVSKEIVITYAKETGNADLLGKALEKK